MKPNDPDMQPDELAELIDLLMAQGTQHINLEIGNETKVQTVNSTECGGKPGACAVPNLPAEDEDDE